MKVFRELNNSPLSSLLERYRNVKVHIPDTLFDVEPEWKLLNAKKCPVCGSLLKFPLKGKIAICYGKRHGNKKPFKITTEKLGQILAKNGII